MKPLKLRSLIKENINEAMKADDLIDLVNSPEFDSLYTITTKSNGDIVISAIK